MQVLPVLASFISDVLVPVLGWLLQRFGDLISFIVGTVLPAIVDFVRGAIDKFNDFIDGVKEVWHWTEDQFNKVVDFVKGLPDKIRTAASGMWDGIRDSFKGVINTIIDWWNGLEFKIPPVTVAGVQVTPGFTLGVPDIPKLRDGGPVQRAAAGLLEGPGTTTSDSILAGLSRKEYVVNAASTAANLPVVEAINAARGPVNWSRLLGIPGLAGGGMAYGLPVGTSISAGAKGFPDWVYELGKRFNVTPSTYAGHQEKDGQNKGIDWSGSVPDMQAFAEYLATVPGMEQVIWSNPQTGEKIGIADGKRVGPGTDQPGYYRDDWAGHTNHVHTRQSVAIGTAGGGYAGVAGTAGAVVGGQGADGKAQSKYTTADAARKDGVVPVWVENMPSGGLGGGSGKSYTGGSSGTSSGSYSGTGTKAASAGATAPAGRAATAEELKLLETRAADAKRVADAAQKEVADAKAKGRTPAKDVTDHARISAEVAAEAAKALADVKARGVGGKRAEFAYEDADRVRATKPISTNVATRRAGTNDAPEKGLRGGTLIYFTNGLAFYSDGTATDGIHWWEIPSIVKPTVIPTPAAPGATATTGGKSVAGAASAGGAATIPLVQNADGTWGSSNPEWNKLIKRESGGDAKITQKISDVNSAKGDPATGLFQITGQTWKANGGSAFAPTAGQATPQQQAQVAAAIFNKSGVQPWGGRENEAALRAGLTTGANSTTTQSATLPGSTAPSPSSYTGVTPANPAASPVTSGTPGSAPSLSTEQGQQQTNPLMQAAGFGQPTNKSWFEAVGSDLPSQGLGWAGDALKEVGGEFFDLFGLGGLLGKGVDFGVNAGKAGLESAKKAASTGVQAAGAAGAASGNPAAVAGAGVAQAGWSMFSGPITFQNTKPNDVSRTMGRVMGMSPSTVTNREV
ncbi:hypothetical protein FK268_12570 [Tsukamurella sputi]|uniref:Resuscitation-promoting factor core lysozyme-like domain-containing protein n=2 Tax=Tsukamurella sputi TaxID=2591848 RepID=A0A5C5RPA4_9ACTN|nr:hypothetical protein FK268_12570 [Tsukamurella sputi]